MNPCPPECMMRVSSHHIMVSMTSKNVQRGAYSFEAVICMPVATSTTLKSPCIRADTEHHSIFLQLAYSAIFLPHR